VFWVISCGTDRDIIYIIIQTLSQIFLSMDIKDIHPSEKCQNYLNRFHTLRYPDPGTRIEVDVNHWEKTKSLFEELRTQVPEEISKQIIKHERYSSNVKSDKPIWS